jgi:hypothetical protein
MWLSPHALDGWTDAVSLCQMPSTETQQRKSLRRDGGQNGKVQKLRSVKMFDRETQNVIHFRTEGVFFRWHSSKTLFDSDFQMSVGKDPLFA